MVCLTVKPFPLCDGNIDEQRMLFVEVKNECFVVRNKFFRNFRAFRSVVSVVFICFKGLLALGKGLIPCGIDEEKCAVPTATWLENTRDFTEKSPDIGRHHMSEHGVGDGKIEMPVRIGKTKGGRIDPALGVV